MENFLMKEQAAEYENRKFEITQWLSDNGIEEDEEFEIKQRCDKIRFHNGLFEEYIDWYHDGNYSWMILLVYELDELLKSERETK